MPDRTKQEYYKQWREANKEALAEKQKQYYEANKEAIAIKRKQYCEDNKEELKAFYSEKIQCECGCMISKRNIARHCNSLKHNKYVGSL